MDNLSKDVKNQASNPVTMRTIRFRDYGEPTDVLHLEEAAIPEPGPGRIRVSVRACGLNPVDWAMCRGHFASQLPVPRGIGLDVSGIVDAVGEGVTNVAIGDAVLGAADFMDGSSAGASDRAIMYYWFRMPAGLDFVQAAALPMAVETAYRGIDTLGVRSGQTVLVHGAGTTVGFAAVQIALMRGAHVVATAGSTYADQLRAMGAMVTSYGDGLVERVAELAKQPVDLVLDAAPIGGAMKDLIHIVNGLPQRVLTVSDFAAAAELGVRASYGEVHTLRYDVVGDFAQYTAEGKFTIPVARTFSLDDWRTALEISQSKRAHGKLILLPAAD
ncbi:NADP-dependent oxidoreductase [Paenibacillus sp. GCM10023248]|uniref:NADP-dependent oxidoreductase n=1 Tax=Bacillales TaxID=1385 RepID=UPI002377D3FE|nr:MULTISPECIES: NADP-dependent oxidoreductase [Bacillales]MDD9271742.1 NADP-dependent oxidoreductase [Paenibacillus sp. MAHUQ-63]MDR6884624.1 NADPH:quinone reductase-like Zn-dependent oxidoreductase [Bacillus sp. 3255]